MWIASARSEEHTSELQSRRHLVCRLLLEKKKTDGCTRTDRGDRDGPLPASPPHPARGVQSVPTGGLGSRVALLGVPVSGLFFFLKKRGPPESSPFPHPAPFPS